MPERTAQTTGGRTITKDRQSATATATTTQGAGLGHLLREMRGLGTAIGIAIEIENGNEHKTGSEIAIGTTPGDLTGTKAKGQETKASKAMAKTRWVPRLGSDQAHIGSHMDSDQSCLFSYSDNLSAYSIV